MKWVEQKPVMAGDIVEISLFGELGKYRALRSVSDVLDLRICDLCKISDEAEGKE